MSFYPGQQWAKAGIQYLKNSAPRDGDSSTKGEKSLEYNSLAYVFKEMDTGFRRCDEFLEVPFNELRHIIQQAFYA